MASVKHKKVLVITDDGQASAAGQVLPSDWNDSHSVSLVVADLLALDGLTSASLATEAFVGDLHVAGSATFSGTAAFLSAASISGTLSVGFLWVGGHNLNISLSQSVSTGQVLTWDNSNNKWVNATPGALAVGSATRSTAALTCHGSASFSGTAVFKRAIVNEGTETVSGNARFLTNADVSGTLSVGSLIVAGTATFTGPNRVLGALDVSATISVGVLLVAGNAKVSATLSVGTLQIAGVTFTPGSYVTSASLITAAYVTSNSLSARIASLSLDVIADVSLSLSVADGQVLTWNNTSNQWINATPAAASSATKTAGAFYNKGSLTQSGIAVFKSGVTFDGTVSFSATAVFTNLSVTTLGVTGTTSFSGTVVMTTDAIIGGNLTVGTINGNPAGAAGVVLLGSVSFDSAAGFKFSGSWSAYIMFKLYFTGTVSALVTTPSFAVYTDGGTTPFLNMTTNMSLTSVAQDWFMDINIMNGTALKVVTLQKSQGSGAEVNNTTATANTGFINAIGMSFGSVTSATLSRGMAILFGFVGRS